MCTNARFQGPNGYTMEAGDERRNECDSQEPNQRETAVAQAERRCTVWKVINALLFLPCAPSSARNVFWTKTDRDWGPMPLVCHDIIPQPHLEPLEPARARVCVYVCVYVRRRERERKGRKL